MILRVKDQTGNEYSFRIRRSTDLRSVKTAYATRAGVNESAIRFLFDGEQIPFGRSNIRYTAAYLDLYDNDQIDCLTEQMGDIGVFAQHSGSVGVRFLDSSSAPASASLGDAELIIRELGAANTASTHLRQFGGVLWD